MGVVVHGYNPRIPKVKEDDQNQPAWATRDPVSQKQKQKAKKPNSVKMWMCQGDSGTN